MSIQPNLPALLQAFFTDRLIRQMQASSQTVASYRDTFCLLFKYVQSHLNKAPSELVMEDLDAPLIAAFLSSLESERKNTARTRNARLAAIHSFFKYAALNDPVHSGVIQRVLAIPSKRCDKPSVQYLTRPETEALLTAPDQTTRGGRRDHALILLAVETGLRVSELINLNCKDVVLRPGAHVHCKGKGRKERTTPLRKETADVIRLWLDERKGSPPDPLFPNSQGGRLSRDGVEYLIRKHMATAMKECQSLENKRVSPHTLRHTSAMDLLQHGVNRSVIALWLGHETLDTVNVYVHANLKMKEDALAKINHRDGPPPGRYRPNDTLLTFLKNL